LEYEVVVKKLNLAPAAPNDNVARDASTDDTLLEKIVSLEEQLALREKELDEVVINRNHILSQLAEYEEKIQNLISQSEKREKDSLSYALLKDEHASLQSSVINMINERNCIMEQLEVLIYYDVF
jgi:septal ring factor EnvC (AmiA/AmiB activator)